MSETAQIIFLLCILVLVYILTRKVHVWKMRRAYTYIVKDLEARGAFDQPSAVSLPYAKQKMLRIGARDYRPKTLEFLVASNIVGMTDSGTYYIKNKEGLKPRPDSPGWEM